MTKTKIEWADRVMKYADELPYWKTSQSFPDTWIDRAIKTIETFGGEIISEAFGRDRENRSAFLIVFKIGGDIFKIVWPVLQSKKGEIKPARVQAATMMYHDIKAKCLTAEVLGARFAFFSYLMLPDGRTASEASIPELQKGIPSLINSMQIVDHIVDADYTEEK